jgi:hypothetical protein
MDILQQFFSVNTRRHTARGKIGLNSPGGIRYGARDEALTQDLIFWTSVWEWQTVLGCGEQMQGPAQPFGGDSAVA